MSDHEDSDREDKLREALNEQWEAQREERKQQEEHQHHEHLPIEEPTDWNPDPDPSLTLRATPQNDVADGDGDEGMEDP